MMRALLSLLLAVALLGAVVTSAAHASAHAAPQGAHDRLDAGPMEPNDHAAALAGCCDVLGAKMGGTCIADAVQPSVSFAGLDGAARAVTRPAGVVDGNGVDATVPTGPPKV